MEVHKSLFLQTFLLSSPGKFFVLLPVQYPVAVGTEGYALLGRFFDGLIHVLLLHRQFVDGAFIDTDYVMEVDDRYVLGTTMCTHLLGFELDPPFALSGFACRVAFFD